MIKVKIKQKTPEEFIAYLEGFLEGFRKGIDEDK